jgi:hypothetical protein
MVPKKKSAQRKKLCSICDINSTASGVGIAALRRNTRDVRCACA